MDDSVPSRTVRFALQLPASIDCDRPRSLAVAQFDSLYHHVADYYARLGEPTTIHFHWHNRAPLGADFFRDTFDRQRQFFGKTSPAVSNSIQLRLDALDEHFLSLGEESGSSCALELLTNLYEDPETDGTQAESVAPKLARLAALGTRTVAVSCTTVLSKLNLAHLDDIHRFFAESKIKSWELLPLFDQPLLIPPYSYEHELTAAETQAALGQLFELMLARGSDSQIAPVLRYLQQVLHHHNPALALRFHSKREWEDTYVVDATGEVRGLATVGERDGGYGNLFQMPLDAIVSSTMHQRAIVDSERRLATTCSPCRFFGSCDGSPVAEAARRTAGRAMLCPITQTMLLYTEQRLQDVGAVRPLRSQHSVQQLRGIESLLRPGVRLHFLADESDLAKSRLMLSSGTTPISPGSESDVRYHVGAIIPREPWREPTAVEYERLTAAGSPRESAEWRLDADVAVVRLPAEVLSPLTAICEDCGMYAGLDAGARPSHAEHPNWAFASRQLTEYLQRYCLDRRPIEATALYTARPGLRTVTRIGRDSENREVYPGLHVDSWEGTPLRQRSGVRNRICVNLGRADRYFLFVNLTLASMMRAIGLADSDDVREVSLFVAHRFLRREPSYPVVRLKLAPCEAYIAPTGNLVHDGASSDIGAPDIAMHLLGYFGVQRTHAEPVS